MEWPQLEYGKLFPADVLMDINRLTALQCGGWARIWLELWRFHPPGVMACDLAKLQMFAQMNNTTWKGNLLPILGRFVFHPQTLTLHEPKIQRLYLAYALPTLRKIAGGKAGAARKHKQRIGPTLPESFGETPYASYKDPFWEIRPETWPKIAEMLSKNGESLAYLKDTSGIATGMPRNITYLREVSTETPTASASGREGGAEGEAGGTEENITAFIAARSDEELTQIKNAMLVSRSQFDQAFYQDRSPRTGGMLARLMYEFYCSQRPAQANAAAAG
jgi:hypothetical protein